MVFLNDCTPTASAYGVSSRDAEHTCSRGEFDVSGGTFQWMHLRSKGTNSWLGMGQRSLVTQIGKVNTRRSSNMAGWNMDSFIGDVPS